MRRERVSLSKAISYGALGGLVIGMVFVLVEGMIVSRANDLLFTVIQLSTGIIGGVLMGIAIRAAANR